MPKQTITVTINGVPYTRTIDVRRMLVDFIREDVGLLGTKRGCNEGACGACTVILDGVSVESCMMLAVEADGGNVTTIEGLGDETMHPLQQAFLDAGAVQCGFCTPGMILQAKAILDKDPSPTAEEVREGMSGNICRCTGYTRIVDAILLAAERMKEHK